MRRNTRKVHTMKTHVGSRACAHEREGAARAHTCGYVRSPGRAAERPRPMYALWISAGERGSDAEAGTPPRRPWDGTAPWLPDARTRPEVLTRRRPRTAEYGALIPARIMRTESGALRDTPHRPARERGARPC
ncbi:hypothetical protein GCM10007147_10210 [Nocardiopsis kunsanensis]|uniref:Uncharacterized protein n=1 Tax=Nocardiopsis kunsanensis TaxID=141693 RepID=A0A918XAD5_9ACTN|nr:hypothetical protein GCM10007147_10210 [Nocardiopsis kunsanensis]